MSDATPSFPLTTPLTEIPSIRPAVASTLVNLGVKNVGQLIAYLPMRHERLEAESPISQLTIGSIATARGEVTATRIVRHGRRPRFEAVLMDESGRLDLVWFNATYLQKTIHPGMRLRVQGKVARFGPGIQVANPKFEAIRPETDEPPVREARIRPVYSATEAVDSRQIESALQSVLPRALPQIQDHLTEEFRASRNFPELSMAYRMMHTPATEEEAASARRRLAYDELLMLQLGVHLKRAHLRQTLQAPALRWSEPIDRHIRERFPFTLTADQDEVITEVVADLTRPVPMNRLLQGDVGSGKTVVALYSMLLAAASGHQAALMAPTEILAEQHAASIGAMLEGSKIRVELLTSGLAPSDRARVLEGLESGQVDIVVGTHALLTESVKFSSLAVAIIDEQHRFGVHQRATLRSKGSSAPSSRSPEAKPEETGPELTPHVLVMTATPIPRTLAITLFGDLDVSTIRHLPPGRTPVKTRVVGYAKAGEVYRFARERIDAGDQAFFVVPAIDTGGGAEPAEEGVAGINDVRSLMSRLESQELHGVSVASMHGRLARATREQIMGQFRLGRIKALVATTVIEVGVDVPNATVMIVEHADRFGLAQLHQLRGRVGRGARPSVCVLLADPVTAEGAQRVKILSETTDGFELAERDMELRGPGELFGTKQAGMPPFKVADLMKDRDLLNLARRDAAKWIERSPGLAAPEEQLLKRRLIKAHGPWLGLGDVG